MLFLGGKKALPLCILQILKDYSDSDHPLTYKDIIRKLQQDYGVEATRNEIGPNISLLCEMAMISAHMRRMVEVLIFHRANLTMELRVLIDSVLISKYISASDAKHLVEKLEQFLR